MFPVTFVTTNSFQIECNNTSDIILQIVCYKIFLPEMLYYIIIVNETTDLYAYIYIYVKFKLKII